MGKYLVFLFYSSLASGYMTPSYGNGNNCYSPLESAILFASQQKQIKKSGSTKEKLRTQIDKQKQLIRKEEERLDEIAGNLADSLKYKRKENLTIGYKVQEYMENEYSGWECGKGSNSRGSSHLFFQKGSDNLQSKANNNLYDKSPYLFNDIPFWTLLLLPQISWGEIKLLEGLFTEKECREECKEQSIKKENCIWEKISENNTGYCRKKITRETAGEEVVKEEAIADTPSLPQCRNGQETTECNCNENMEEVSSSGKTYCEKKCEDGQVRTGRQCRRKCSVGDRLYKCSCESPLMRIQIGTKYYCTTQCGENEKWDVGSRQCVLTKKGACERQGLKLYNGICMSGAQFKCEEFGNIWDKKNKICKSPNRIACESKKGYRTSWKWTGGLKGRCQQTNFGKCKGKPNYGQNWEWTGGPMGRCAKTDKLKCEERPNYGLNWVWKEGKCQQTASFKCKGQDGWIWKPDRNNPNGGECVKTDKLKCKQQGSDYGWDSKEKKCKSRWELACKGKPGYGSAWIWKNNDCHKTDFGKCQDKPNFGTDWKWTMNGCLKTDRLKCKEKGPNYRLDKGKCKTVEQLKCEGTKGEWKNGYCKTKGQLDCAKKGSDYGWDSKEKKCKSRWELACKGKPGYGSAWIWKNKTCQKTDFGECQDKIKKNSGSWRWTGRPGGPGTCVNTNDLKCKKKNKQDDNATWELKGKKCIITTCTDTDKEPNENQTQCVPTEEGKCKDKDGYGIEWKWGEKQGKKQCVKTGFGECKSKPNYGKDWIWKESGGSRGGRCIQTNRLKCKNKNKQDDEAVWELKGKKCIITECKGDKKVPSEDKKTCINTPLTTAELCEQEGNNPKGSTCFCAEGNKVIRCVCSGEMEKWKDTCKAKCKRGLTRNDSGNCVECPKEDNKDWQNDKAFGRNGRVNKSFCKRHAKDKRECRRALAGIEEALDELDWLKDRLKQTQRQLRDKEMSMEDTNKKTQAALPCVGCQNIERLRSMNRQLSGSQMLGNFLSIGVGAVGSYWGIKEARRSQALANEWAGLQGFRPKDNFGYSFAAGSVGVPFIARGIRGLIQGNASRGGYACSPTLPPYNHFPGSSYYNPHMMY